MRFDNLVLLAKSCIKISLCIIIVFTVLYSVGYLLLYRTIFKRKKVITVSTFIWVTMVCCYLASVLVAVFSGRGSINVRKIRPLFSSYKEAWHTWSFTDWRNIVLNYCLFVPFGFLLPVRLKPLRNMLRIGLLAFLFTFTVECVQLLLKTGVFEMDDLLGNTLGALVGYGCYGFVSYIVALFRKKPDLKVSRIILLQIPLFVILLGYAGMLLIYNTKQFGNNKNSFYYGYDSGEFNVTSDYKLSDTEQLCPLYKTEVLSLNEALELCEKKMNVLEWTGHEKIKEIFEDHVYVCYSPKGSGEPAGLRINSCNSQYRGGLYRCNITFGALWNKLKEEMKIENPDDCSIKEALAGYGEIIPDGYVFKNMGHGKYAFLYDFVQYDNGYLYGSYICTIVSNTLRSYDNSVYKCTYVGKYPIISEKEAFMQIVNGRFRLRGENIAKGLSNDERLNINITSCVLEYEPDSKGYLQPQYRFNCIINGQNKDVLIPALIDR